MKYQGKKLSGTHTTVVDGAEVFVKFADTCTLVTKISLGYIKMIPRSRNTQRRIKLKAEQACVFIIIRSNRSTQEFRFFTSEVQKLKQELQKFATEKGFQIK